MISTITPGSSGSVTLTVATRVGHRLTISVPGRTLVYSVIAGTQENGHVPDLFVGEHIATKGARTGKFTLSATSIHIYPRQHTVGGTVASVTLVSYRMLGTDGKQYIVRINAKTAYTLNGKKSSGAAVRRGVHIRVRGYDALESAQRGLPTIIAAHVSIIVHTTQAKVKAGATPTRAPTRVSATMHRAKGSTAAAASVAVTGG